MTPRDDVSSAMLQSINMIGPLHYGVYLRASLHRWRPVACALHQPARQQGQRMHHLVI